MRLREATRDDVPAIRENHRESIRELGRRAYSRRQVDAWAAGVDSADYAAVGDSRFRFVVAETDDADVVGFGSLRLDAPEVYEAAVDAEVTGIYVAPDAAGQGVGTAILADLERTAEERATTRLGLTASLNAVGFYERHGYERVHTTDHEFSAHESTGVTGRVVEMVKSL